MNYVDIKSALSDYPLEREVAFSILKGISRHVNNRDEILYQQGRDLVIRALAKADQFSHLEKQVLGSLVRAVGLYPYLTDLLEYVEIDDQIAYELHRIEGLQEVFHSLQARIYYLLMAGYNVILSANTSVGKSLIIDAVIASRKHKKIVIVVPTLALVDETRKRIKRRFGEECNLITHIEQVFEPGKMNVYVLTQERVRQRIDLSNVDFFAVDEFYKMDLRHKDDSQRAIELNLAFHKLASSGAQFYMLGPNVDGLRGLDRYEVHFIPSKYSTVAVDVEHFNLPKLGDDRPNKLVELLFIMTGPTLIYCSGPSSASKVARLITKRIFKVGDERCQQLADWVSINYHAQWVLTDALRHGIGLHHGGIPRPLQQLMVRLFNDHHLHTLICTSTLVEGVNTVAENVVIYDRRKSTRVLDFFTYKNIQGRAGRMGKYYIGRVFVLEALIEEETTIVEYPIGNQSSETPLSLIMQLDAENLTALSLDRLDEALDNKELSSETMRLNSEIDPEIQNALAIEVRKLLQNDYSAFLWTGTPNQKQLYLICSLMLRFFAADRMKAYRIQSPEGFAWYIRALELGSGIKGFIAAIVNGVREGQDVSNEIDRGLRLLRNVIVYHFPRELMIIDRIQREISQDMGLSSGNFVAFASMTENMFLSPVLLPLEEYGIPHQIIRKIPNLRLSENDLNSNLNAIKNLPSKSLGGLEEIEARWLKMISEDL